MGIHWAPNGKHLLSSTLYERVKVDNEIRIYNATAQHVCSLSFKEFELYEAHWQPYPKGVLTRPDIRQLEAQKHFEDSKKPLFDKPEPKKWFNPSGSGNTFAQIMRQEMSKTHEKGPKKVDKVQYQEIMKEQAQQHAQILANANNVEESPAVRQSWRKGYIQA